MFEIPDNKSNTGWLPKNNNNNNKNKIQFHDDLIFLPLCVLPFNKLRERNGRRISHGKQQIA